MRAQLCKKQVSGIALFVILSGGSVFAENEIAEVHDSPRLEYHTTFGYARIALNELVFNHHNDERVSHLMWEAEFPTVTFGGRYDLTNEWFLSGNLRIGADGDGVMTDYDWLDPYAEGTGYDQWTHRSQHPNTELKSYVDLDLALGRNFPLNDATTINLHGGIKYSKAEFDARGGSYIRSKNGFRDDRGEFSHNQKIISYKLWHRTVFAGAEIVHHTGDWELSGLLRAGLSIEPRDVDNHWLRDLRFVDRFDSEPFAQVRLGAERQLRNEISLFAGISYQKYFEKQGDTYVYDDGGKQKVFNNSAGADMSVTSFEIGISRNF